MNYCYRSTPSFVNYYIVEKHCASKLANLGLGVDLYLAEQDVISN